MLKKNEFKHFKVKSYETILITKANDIPYFREILLFIKFQKLVCLSNNNTEQSSITKR